MYVRASRAVDVSSLERLPGELGWGFLYKYLSLGQFRVTFFFFVFLFFLGGGGRPFISLQDCKPKFCKIEFGLYFSPFPRYRGYFGTNVYTTYIRPLSKVRRFDMDRY
jgi:hypothetical protein